HLDPPSRSHLRAARYGGQAALRRAKSRYGGQAALRRPSLATRYGEQNPRPTFARAARFGGRAAPWRQRPALIRIGAASSPSAIGSLAQRRRAPLGGGAAVLRLSKPYATTSRAIHASFARSLVPRLRIAVTACPI